MKLIRRGTFVFAIAAIAVLAFGTTAQASSHANSSPITINDVGPATPYPSAITVAGIQGTTMDVNVTLTGFSHSYMSDTDVLLVGPGGQKIAVMSDAGGFSFVSGLNLTLDDQAATAIPDSGVQSGSYKPTDVDGFACPDDNYPAPAPAGPYGSSLGALNGGSPNGTWNLFVRDDCFFDVGSISGGWSLSIRACILPEVVALTDPTPAGPVVAALLCT